MPSGTEGQNTVIMVNTGTLAVPIWTLVAGQRNAIFSDDAGEVDFSSKDDVTYSEFGYGKLTGTVNFSGMIVVGDSGYAKLRQAWQNRELVRLVERLDGVNLQYQDAVITNLTRTYPDGDASTYDVATRVSGAPVPL